MDMRVAIIAHRIRPTDELYGFGVQNVQIIARGVEHIELEHIRMRVQNAVAMHALSFN